MRSLTQHAGYLAIDHRESPGVTAADVAHLPSAIPVGAGQLFEADTKQCAHCQATVVLHPGRTRPRGYCAKCHAYICDGAICNAGCSPLAARFDAVKE